MPCQLFSLQPKMFPTDEARVAYIITQLSGKAKKWGTAAWSADLPWHSIFPQIHAEDAQNFRPILHWSGCGT